MKFHLPVKLFHAVLTGASAVTFTVFATLSSISYASAAEAEAPIRPLSSNYPGGSKIFTTTQESLQLTGCENINFKDIVNHGGIVQGGAFHHFSKGNTAPCKLNGNGDVTFSGNAASARSNADFALADGGAIHNYYDATFTLNNNKNVSFKDNTASAQAESALPTHTSSILYAHAQVQGGAIHNYYKATFELNQNYSVQFIGNSAATSACLTKGSGDLPPMQETEDFPEGESYILSLTEGGAVHNMNGTFSMCDNHDVTFSGNIASATGNIGNEADADASASVSVSGGAICSDNQSVFTICHNENVAFNGNTASATVCMNNKPNADASVSVSVYGGAICNFGSNTTFTLSDNGNVTFSGNSASARSDADFGSAEGGAIYNYAQSAFAICHNDNVVFSNNIVSGSFASGGAIYNTRADFTICDNGNVTFRGNIASADNTRGGAICNTDAGTFTIIGNGDVLFEKNAEISFSGYRLRSIYSTGTLNLSASEGKSILFKDSIYAERMVNLNQDGTGDIIFSAATTEADLREVKGGIDGTAEEILNSRTSEIATNAKLYGGRLIVEDGAILKGQGITVMENANAVIRLNNGEIDESGYEIAVSTGSGLEFEGANTLTASAIRMEDGAALSFVLGDSMEPLVNLNATLLTGSLSITLSGNTSGTHQLISLHDASQYDLSLWTEDNITLNGASFSDFSWNAGVLTYRAAPPVIDVENDTTLESDSAEADKLQSGGEAIINGNGHSLTVKNEVQLVQMALKNGTVKLEGENNNVVSVTLTEDGTLVLTAGAGLKTGDIISMVASGKGELVISGDITLDEHGMKGKNGQKATVSNMSATTTGDAVFENVAFTDSLLDIGEGTTATFKNAVLGAGTRVTDAPATAKFENTLALLDSTNTEVVTESTTAAALQLYMSGDTANAVTLDAGAALVDLTCTVFDTITLSGSDLFLDLTSLAVTLGDADAFSLTFTNGTLAAIDTDSLHIYATLDGEHYLAGYTTQQGGMADKVYFTTSASVPEPATATLSLLALAALAARRKRVA